MRFFCCLFLVLCIFFMPHALFAQEEDSFDVDSMFETAEDVEVPNEQQQNPPPVVMPTAGDLLQNIKFYGSFNASMGLVGKIYPDDLLMPFASFENYLGDFTAF